MQFELTEHQAESLELALGLLFKGARSVLKDELSMVELAAVKAVLKQLKQRESGAVSLANIEIPSGTLDIEHVTVYFDGSCNPNPGQMGIGCFCPETGWTLRERRGQGTNNVAELLAATEAIKYINRLHSEGSLKTADVVGDSQLAIYSLKKKWKLKDARLKKLRDEALKPAPKGVVTFEWVRRLNNSVADRLASQA